VNRRERGNGRDTENDRERENGGESENQRDIKRQT